MFGVNAGAKIICCNNEYYINQALTCHQVDGILFLSRCWAGAVLVHSPLIKFERMIKMNIDEKAMMILEGMETYMQIDWNLEQWYLDAIKVGLKEIEKKEKELKEEK